MNVLVWVAVWYGYRDAVKRVSLSIFMSLVSNHSGNFFNDAKEERIRGRGRENRDGGGESAGGWVKTPRAV